jgi:hypothetical protein
VVVGVAVRGQPHVGNRKTSKAAPVNVAII